MLRRLLDPRIILDVQSPARLWSVEADPGQVNQVLTNLCLNARDAMPEGGRLSLQTENIVLDVRHAQQLGADSRPGEFVRRWCSMCAKEYSATRQTQRTLSPAA